MRSEQKHLIGIVGSLLPFGRLIAEIRFGIAVGSSSLDFGRRSHKPVGILQTLVDSRYADTRLAGGVLLIRLSGIALGRHSGSITETAAELTAGRLLGNLGIVVDSLELFRR